jgi:hypothetical protein
MRTGVCLRHYDKHLARLYVALFLMHYTRLRNRGRVMHPHACTRNQNRSSQLAGVSGSREQRDHCKGVHAPRVAALLEVVRSGHARAPSKTMRQKDLLDLLAEEAKKYSGFRLVTGYVGVGKDEPSSELGG